MMEVEQNPQQLVDASAVENAQYPAEIYFDNTASVEFGFEALQQVFDMETNVKTEIKRLQAHFSQLKMDYLFLETKQGILEVLQRPDFETVISEHQDIAAFQSKSGAGKTKLHAIKTEIRALKKKLRVVIPQLSEKWESYKTQHEEFVGSYDKENDRAAVDKTNAALALNELTNVYGKSEADDLQLDSAVKCHRVLKNQARAVEDGNRHFTELSRRLAGLNEQLQPLSEEVERMETEYTATIAKLATEEGKAAERLGFPYAAQVDWYQNAVALLEKVNGFEVALSEGNVVTVTYSLPNNKSEKMAVQFNQDGTKFTSVELEGYNVADVVEFAISTQDLTMLVSEVQQRLLKDEKRTQEIQTVIRHWPNSVWEDPVLRAALTSSSGDGLVQVTLHVSPDYPAPHAAILCKAVSVISGSVQQAKLDSVLDCTNLSTQAQSGGSSMAEFLVYLQNACF